MAVPDSGVQEEKKTQTSARKYSAHVLREKLRAAHTYMHTYMHTNMYTCILTHKQGSKMFGTE